eukprot:TRINITY_DN16487_c0_g1_i3.p1 TRINITY_DN16487_c0_g1~~TRINITY_DN16487_c0_g1_i3.p1  ORF type:complete len:109 (-),score=34.36 TRINITY_DN16487_c0_g1_i3:78-404(-)
MAMVRAWLGWVLVATAQAACSQSDTQVTGCSAAGCSTVATCSSGYAVACATSPAATGDGITPTSTSCTAFTGPVSYTHLRAHETPEHLVCRLLLEKKKKKKKKKKTMS